jgi:hypothetical protein
MVGASRRTSPQHPSVLSLRDRPFRCEGAVSNPCLARGGRIMDALIEYLVLREQLDGNRYPYPIQLVRGMDGVWRVEGM